ncbi:MAG: hypothetical protein ACODAD_01375 [Planctomycetota bacterium]
MRRFEFPYEKSVLSVENLLLDLTPCSMFQGGGNNSSQRRRTWPATTADATGLRDW